MALVSLFFLKIVFQVVIYPLFVIFHLILSHLYNYVSNNHRTSYKRKQRWRCHRDTHGSPPPPFSVRLHDATIAHTSIVLSAIQIAPALCPPLAQTINKSVRFTTHNHTLHRQHLRRFKLRGFYKIILFPLLLFQRVPTIHAIPGTSYAVIDGEQSLDNTTQLRLANNIVHQLAPPNAPMSPDSTPSPPSYTPPYAFVTSNDDLNITGPPPLRQEPICFVADTDSVEYVVDLAANRIVLNDSSLMTDLKITSATIKGIGGKGVPISGIGKFALPLRSDDGSFTTISNLDAVFVPSSPYNLIPPQLLLSAMRSQGYLIDDFSHTDKIYTFKYSSPGCHDKPFSTLTVPIGRNGLFTFRSNDGYTAFMSRASTYCPEYNAFAGSYHVIPDANKSSAMPTPSSTSGNPREQISSSSSTTTSHSTSREQLSSTTLPSHHKTREVHSTVDSTTNADLEPLRTTPLSSKFSTNIDHSSVQEDANIAAYRRKQMRLLTVHETLGHLGFATLKLMARCGLLPRDLASVDPPTCPGCAYGKAHRRQWRYKGAQNRRQIRSATSPGEVVSVDQLISPTPGFVPVHRGLPTVKRYIGATVFVDHYSDYTYVHLMTEMDAKATIEAKDAFERLAASHAVRIRHYHCDNGLFDTNAFKASIIIARQTISFCGVNAHHQNGKAERRIGDITTGTRTSLLHASHRWPSAVHVSLWPMAMKNYTNLRNNIPSTFIKGAKIGRKQLPDEFVNSPLSKFSGIEIKPNLSHFHPFGSPVYVLAPNLQAVKSHNKWSDRSRVGIFLCHSPEHSSSVPLVLNTTTANVSPQFHCLYDDEFATCKRDAKFTSVWQIKARLQDAPPSIVDLVDKNVTLPPFPSSHPKPSVNLPPTFISNWEATPVEPLPSGPPHTPEPSHPPSTIQTVPVQIPPRPTEHITPPSLTPPITSHTSRSGRTIRPPVRFDDSHHSSLHAHTSTFTPTTDGSNDCLLQPSTANYSEPHPMALLCRHMVAFITTDPDTMTLTEALQQPDRANFILAMHKELNEHISRCHWKVVSLKDVPSHKRRLPMVWSMKRKRNPIGEIVKWKARLCAGGHRSIEFVDYWDTYSPVVSWQTIRLVFTLAIVNNWYIHSIDFIMAFPQATVKTDIFMQPPRVPHDFKIPDLPSFTDRFTHAYKLLKNLYGLKDAGRTWNHHLKHGLLKRGWKQSTIDECLFTKSGLLLILYVDDACIISPSQSKIVAEITSLKKDYALTDEGKLQDYLGTRFDRNSDGSVTLTQPRMIDRALSIVGLNHQETHVKMHDTPAVDVLTSSPSSKPRLQKWNYRSAVGCLSYIQAMIRPDITMAVQQCARFCTDPKQDHEEAVKRICRYLLKTRDKGLILRPDKSKGLECFVDADWAGSWSYQSSMDPLSTHSRTGFVILYAGCPILWKSKIQSITALSTTEAEYIALSSALREVIGLIHLLEDLNSKGLPIHCATPKIKCRTFEDNKSCVNLATTHRTRPRTKHLSLRLHHFRSYIVNKIITVEHVSTKEQLADIFTKPLPRVQYCKLRDRLMTW